MITITVRMTWTIQSATIIMKLPRAWGKIPQEPFSFQRALLTPAWGRIPYHWTLGCGTMLTPPITPVDREHTALNIAAQVLRVTDSRTITTDRIMCTAMPPVAASTMWALSVPGSALPCSTGEGSRGDRRQGRPKLKPTKIWTGEWLVPHVQISRLSHFPVTICPFDTFQTVRDNGENLKYWNVRVPVTGNVGNSH